MWYCWWQRGEEGWGTQWRFIGPGSPVLHCGFAVPAGSGLGVCPELGRKNALNWSRFHQDKHLSSIPYSILVTRLINWVILVYTNDHSQCLTVLQRSVHWSFWKLSKASFNEAVIQIFNYTQVKNLTNTGPDLCLCYTGEKPVESLFKQLSFLGI